MGCSREYSPKEGWTPKGLVLLGLLVCPLFVMNLKIDRLLVEIDSPFYKTYGYIRDPYHTPVFSVDKPRQQ